MFCTNCGTQNNPETKFCVGCGNPLNNQQIPVQPEQVNTQQVVNQQVEQNTYQTQQPNQYDSQGYTTQNVVQPQNDVNPVQPKKSNAGKIILIVVAVILILGILAVMAVVNFVKGVFNKVTNSDEVQGIIKTYEEMENIADETMDILEKKADELEALDVKSIVENSKVQPIEVKVVEQNYTESIKGMRIDGEANIKNKKYEDLFAKSRKAEYYKNFINQNKEALGIDYNADFSTDNFGGTSIEYYSDENGFVRIEEDVLNSESSFWLTVIGGIEGNGKEKVFYDVVKQEFGIDLSSITEYTDTMKKMQEGEVDELHFAINDIDEDGENDMGVDVYREDDDSSKISYSIWFSKTFFEE